MAECMTKFLIYSAVEKMLEETDGRTEFERIAMWHENPNNPEADTAKAKALRAYEKSLKGEVKQLGSVRKIPLIPLINSMKDYMVLQCVLEMVHLMDWSEQNDAECE